MVGLMNCDICESEDQVEALPLYCWGSEDTCLCYDCRMSVIRFIQERRSLAMDVRKREIMKRKR